MSYFLLCCTLGLTVFIYLYLSILPLPYLYVHRTEIRLDVGVEVAKGCFRVDLVLLRICDNPGWSSLWFWFWFSSSVLVFIEFCVVGRLFVFLASFPIFARHDEKGKSAEVAVLRLQLQLLCSSAFRCSSHHDRYIDCVGNTIRRNRHWLLCYCISNAL